jgi:hypothetical protein
MKKFLIICIVFFLHSSANSENIKISYICSWSDNNEPKTTNAVYEINFDKEVFEDNKKVNISFISLTEKNIEYKYSKINNLNVEYNYHFKMNIETGYAFEILSSADNDYTDSYIGICNFI